MWKVAKLSANQLLDVRPEDVLFEGWFRQCNTYRGGGGYDQFPVISEKRFGKRHNWQFIVQLYGCNLDCPYCYVTREGVWGEFKQFNSEDLEKFFMASFIENPDISVFHLMGGAPALQLKQWPELIQALDIALNLGGCVFHSDLMLTEGVYNKDVLKAISHPRALYAVDIKGLTQEEHLRNTRKDFPEQLFWDNLDKLEVCGVPYYITFTAVSDKNIEKFWDLYSYWHPHTFSQRKEESFKINLIEYDALPFVDSRSWGVVK